MLRFFTFSVLVILKLLSFSCHIFPVMIFQGILCSLLSVWKVVGSCLFPQRSSTADESVCGMSYEREEVSFSSEMEGKSGPCWKPSEMRKHGSCWLKTCYLSATLTTSGEGVIPTGL